MDCIAPAHTRIVRGPLAELGLMGQMQQDGVGVIEVGSENSCVTAVFLRRRRLAGRQPAAEDPSSSHTPCRPGWTDGAPCPVAQGFARAILAQGLCAASRTGCSAD